MSGGEGSSYANPSAACTVFLRSSDAHSHRSLPLNPWGAPPPTGEREHACLFPLQRALAKRRSSRGLGLTQRVNHGTR